MRNRMINFRTRTSAGKRVEKVVEIVGESGAQVFATLVTDGNRMGFDAKPDLPKKSGEEPDEVVAPLHADRDAAVDRTDLKLNVEETVSALAAKLGKIRRDAITGIEEQGVNALFLCIGALDWRESESSDETRQAPLILVPVTLEVNARGAYTVKWDGAEPGGNLSIAAKVAADFGVTLPTFEGEADLPSFFARVTDAIDGRVGWRVDGDRVSLSFLSYAKFLMHRDLDPSGWPAERSPVEHSELRALLGPQGFGDDPEEAGPSEEDQLDAVRSVAESCEVFDADSSQTLAIIQAGSGKSMLVEGPPGTGKSQTITNLIAEAVGAGKRVLFVAEKMAALDVVHRRLKAAGLEDASLELHSNKASKLPFYRELKRTVDMARPRLDDATRKRKEFEESRSRLNAHAEAINATVPGRGITVRDAMGRLCTLGPEPANPNGGDPEGRIDFATMVGWDDAALRERLDLTEKLRAHVQRHGSPKANPWYGSTLRSLLPADESDLALRLGETEGAVAEFRDAANRLAETLRVELPERPTDVDRLDELARYVAGAPVPEGVAMGTNPTSVGAGERLVELDRFRAKRDGIAGVARDGALDTAEDPTEARHRIALRDSLGGAYAGLTEESRPGYLAALDEARTAVARRTEGAVALARALGLAPDESAEGAARATDTAARISASPELDGFDATHPDWAGLSDALEAALDDLRKRATLKGRLAGLKPDRFGTPTEPLLGPMEKVTGFRRWFDGKYKTAVRTAGELFEGPRSVDDLIAALKDLHAWQEAEGRLRAAGGRLGGPLGTRWRGTESDVESLEAGRWLVETHRAAAAGRFPAESLRIFSRPISRSDLRDAATETGARTERAERATDVLVRALMPWASRLGTDREALDAALRASAAERERLVAPFLVPGTDAGRADRALALIAEAREIRPRLEADDAASRWFGPKWRGTATDPESCRERLRWSVKLHADIAAGTVPMGLADYFSADRSPTGLDEAVRSAQAARAKATDRVREVLRLAEIADGADEFADAPLRWQMDRLAEWRRTLPAFRSLIAFNSLDAEARRVGLDQTADLAAGWDAAGTRLTESLHRSWATGVLREAYAHWPELARFDREDHEETIAAFKSLDQQLLALNRIKVAIQHWGSVPRQSAGGTLGWLQTQFELKRSHASIRKAMEVASEPIQAIKPVFLMSPLSVAMYLPPKGPKFDLVIFDEASQIRPEDAFGALLRADQAVVVGDSKQMPPTSFFDRLTSGSEEVDEDAPEDESGATRFMTEIESVLGLMSKALPARSPRRRDLRWHYRSQHDSLISTSNRLFYGDRLVVFPSPRRFGTNSGLVFRHHPDTVYDRGGKRNNLREADAIARAVIEQIRRNPGDTIGVAAFSTAQRDAIHDALARLDVPRELADFDSKHQGEPLFVKNLENVQGDERDVIFISVGYGRDASGFVTQSFGPINRDGGERRLNVLATRARKRCEVFTNLRSTDIRVDETTKAGVRSLRTFLEYAEHGKLDRAEETGRPPESPFEEDVMARLRAAGYEVEPQVGSCGFFIDLAVRHPEQPGRFVLGVECDGAMYHSARSARDRDRLRQAVLEKMGWRMHRIWSTDWFHSPDREFRRLTEAIARAIALTDTEIAEQRAEVAASLEMEREAAAADPKPTEYTFAKLKVKRYEELAEVPPSVMAEYVTEVARTEAPVHEEEIIRRIREAHGVSRAGGRILASVQAGIARAVEVGTVERRGEFVYLPGADASTIRDRRNVPGTSKRMEWIAPEEIDAAVVASVTSAYGLSPDEAARFATLRLGFDRCTASMTTAVTSRLAALVESGRLTVEGTLLRPGAPAP